MALDVLAASNARAKLNEHRACFMWAQIDGSGNWKPQLSYYNWNRQSSTFSSRHGYEHMYACVFIEKTVGSSWRDN